MTQTYWYCWDSGSPDDLRKICTKRDSTIAGEENCVRWHSGHPAATQLVPARMLTDGTALAGDFRAGAAVYIGGGVSVVMTNGYRDLLRSACRRRRGA